MLSKIFLTTIDFDIQGALEIECDDISAGLRDRIKRATRRRTLDGGAVMDDRGARDSERTIEIEARLTLAQVATLNHIIEFHSTFKCSTEEGQFVVSPDRTSLAGNLVTLRLYILSRLTA